MKKRRKGKPASAGGAALLSAPEITASNECESLLKLADQEIIQLRENVAAAAQREIQLLREIASLRAELQTREAREETLAEENALLYRRLHVTIPTQHEPLAGLRIGIIGHPSRESDYREIVERLGGKLNYAAAGEKMALIDRVVQKSDGTLHIIAWSNHKTTSVAKAAAERSGKVLLAIDHSGLGALERAICDDLLPLLRHRTRPLATAPA